MARVRRSQVGPDPKGPGALPAEGVVVLAEQHGSPPGSIGVLLAEGVVEVRAADPRVTFVSRLSPRGMQDVTPDAFAWSAEMARSGMRIDPANLAGSILRIRPNAGATAEDVERVRRAFVVAGAVAVKVLPPGHGPSVFVRQEPAASPTTRGIREVVRDCAARARTQDRARLDAVLDAALTQEGV